MLVTSQWYLRFQRLSFPCLAYIPMNNFKRRRYVKFKIKTWNRVRHRELRRSSVRVCWPSGSFALLELVASRQ